VHRALPAVLKAARPTEYQTTIYRRDDSREFGKLAAFVIAGVNRGTVAMGILSLDFSMRRAEGRTDHAQAEQIWQICPTECPDRGGPLVAGLRNGLDVALPDVRRRFKRDAVAAAPALLEAQTAVSRGQKSARRSRLSRSRRRDRMEGSAARLSIVGA
jgi:hypothetical protein